MVRVWLAGVVAIGVVAALLASASHSPSGSDVDPIGKIKAIALDHRVAAAPLSGPLVGGGRFDAAAYAGHVTLINAWGSWCEPCRAELPVLRRLAAASYPTVVKFLGLDVADTTSGAEGMVRQYQIPYPSIYDPDKTAYVALVPALAENVPSTVVIDAKGRLAATVIGPVNEAAMTTYLRQLAAEQP